MLSGGWNWGQERGAGSKDSFMEHVSKSVHSKEDQDFITQGWTRPLQVKTQEHR